MKKIFSVIFTFILSGLLHAGEECYVEYLAPSDASSHGSFDLYDSHYPDMLVSGWQNSFINHSVQNKVWVGYQKDSYAMTDEHPEVKLLIEYWTHDGVNFVYNSINTSLFLDNDDNPYAPIHDISTYSFSGAHRVLVTVVDVIGASSSNIYVKSSMTINRDYLMDINTSNVGFRYPTEQLGYLEFFWDVEKGAQEYELEWAYVSNQDLDIATKMQTDVPASQLSFDFYRNATRVRISDSYYRIPKIFNKGYVVFRVRAIGRMESGYSFEKFGKWTLAENGLLSDVPSATLIPITQDFEQGKNWSHSVSYTENGKRFEGLMFVDGLGFVRQSLAANTETNQLIVNNTYYDRIGRAVLGDLPTPVDETKFHYFDNFNYGVDFNNNNQIAPYGYNHYDYVTETSPCINPAFPFSEQYGAGKYYSQNNPDKEGANANIPDADGYSFSQVEYMNDQTGRIRRVGAFGTNHQIDQNATRFYYDVPLQSELNKLFGTEVGLNEHYQRKITIDPNKQAYVEYYDLAGRVVAHCLVGKAPDNLEPLDNNSSVLGIQTDVIYSSLSEQDYIQEKGISSINFVKTIVSPGDYTFTHEFVPVSFTDNCMPGLCFDCLYDLELKITSIDCPNDEPVYDGKITINGGQIDAICNGEGYAPLTIVKTLTTGQYNISKTLRISEGAAEDYWCTYVENLTEDCAVDYKAIYNNLYANEDLGCNGPTIIHSGNFSDQCDAKRAMMRADMALYGQYGQIIPDSKQNDPNLSVYNTENSLPYGSTADWRHPLTPYINSDGTTAKIYLHLLNGVKVPAVDNTSNILTDANGEYVLPEHLLHLDDFMLYYDPFWADALIPYHPEYCYLQFCEQSSSYHEFLKNLDAIETYDEACAQGLMSFDEDYYINSGDNFFLNSAWQAKENWFWNNYHIAKILDRIDHYFTAPQAVFQFGTDLNLFEYSLYMTGSVGSGYLDNGCASDKINDCDKQKIWAFYKEELKQLRNEYYLLAQTAYVSYPETVVVGSSCSPSFNGCIGDNSYASNTAMQYGLKADEYVNNGFGSNPTHVNTNSGPCFNGTSYLYSDKTARFSNTITQDQLNSNPFNGAANQAEAQAISDAQLASQCQSVCNNYVEEWMEKLSGCNLATDEFSAIQTKLLNVCLGGCDADNVQGASSTAPGSNISPNTFEGVLIQVLGPSRINELCSDLLISEPRPYGQNLSEVLVSDLDQCGCDKIKQAELDFATLSSTNNLPLGVGTIEQMLAYNENISITNAQDLLCACNKVLGNVNWTPSYTWTSTQITALENLHFPVDQSLSCNAGTCQSCTQITALVDNFHDYFGKQSPTEIATFKDHENYEVLLSNYLNNHLAFHLSFDAYETFIEHCEGNANNPNCYTTPSGHTFMDLMDVISRQGFLTSQQNQAYVMHAQNIVYTNSDFHKLLNGHFYWTDYQSGNSSMTLSFGNDNQDDKTVTLNLPQNADFGFEDIIGIQNISAIQGCSGDEFNLLVNIISCGQIQERQLSGSSADLELVTCYCNGNNELLCDDLKQELFKEACYQEKLSILNSISQNSYNEQMAAKKDAFIASYIAKCSEALNSESLSMTGQENYYQYTLYYYDQAGNLTKTVAPMGVFSDQNFPAVLATVDQNRADQTPKIPTHNFETKYVYNSYDQVLETSNPDQHGDTKFYYDFYGRLIASQNPVQRASSTYSYSIFDDQGRPQEVGQATFSSITDETNFINAIAIDDLGVSYTAVLNQSTVTRREVNRTVYDESLSAAIAAKFKTGAQTFLRLRISSVLYFNTFSSNTNIATAYTSAVHYSYDQHGNVIEQIQDVPMLAPVKQDVKSTQYEFELISGNVKKVHYQKGEPDQITHSYTYDKMERLRSVYTSTDQGIHQVREAHYYYYDYGPLARVETGEHQVQAADYAYTINGWLKGSNSTILRPQKDMGKDGASGYYSYNLSQNEHFARDVAAFGLGYYKGDYKGIGTPQFEAALGSMGLVSAIKDLFNGNIAYTTSSIDDYLTQASVYSYDQLNRLKSARTYRDASLVQNNSWGTSSMTQEHASKYSYDENGNLTDLFRNATSPDLLMDAIKYIPQTLNGKPSNRLDHVDEGFHQYTGSDDIEDQSSGNYHYDDLGQLDYDAQEDMRLYWRKGDKKLDHIVHSNLKPNSSDIDFVYNPFGVRILKIEKPRNGGVVSNSSQWIYTYYVHDANEQVMAVYKLNQPSLATGSATLTEQHLYGASRLGIREKNLLLYDHGIITPTPSSITQNTLGEKRYEITNYLGNVNAVISDRKMFSSPGEPSTYEAVIFQKADYYPFGMTMPGRHDNYTSESYRYAYNGMEFDTEMKGDQNSYTTEFRQYDPRLGRWLSVDPMAMEEPGWTPYRAFFDNPIIYTDPSGLYENTKEGRKQARADRKAAIKNANKYESVSRIKYNKDNNQVYFTVSYRDPGFAAPKDVYGKKTTKIRAQARSKSSPNVLLMGGADFYNSGELGNNDKIADAIEVYSLQNKLKIKKGDLQVVNSPILAKGDYHKEIISPIADIIENQSKKGGPVILYGYSFGGHILMKVAEELNKRGVKIDVLITVDAASSIHSFFQNNDLPSNVKYNLNLYQTKPSPIFSHGGPHDGINKVVNINLTGIKNSMNQKIVHSNIDEYTELFVTYQIYQYFKNGGKGDLTKLSKKQILNQIQQMDKMQHK